MIEIEKVLTPSRKQEAIKRMQVAWTDHDEQLADIMSGQLDERETLLGALEAFNCLASFCYQVNETEDCHYDLDHEIPHADWCGHAIAAAILARARGK